MGRGKELKQVENRRKGREKMNLSYSPSNVEYCTSTCSEYSV